MKLTEIKTAYSHYFEDEQGRKQGEFKSWWDNGQRRVIRQFRDDEFHGEYKDWYDNGQQCAIYHYKDGEFHGEFKFWSESGELKIHKFYIDGEIIMNFLKNPELHPTTPEDKTYFALKYGIGDAQFIGDSSETN